MKQSDVLIIGAGVIGCMTARELSAYDFSITVLEKNSDVCEETSKANSGIVHSGVDAKVGTQKAKYNLLGNQMMKQTCEDLEVAFVQNGSLILAFFEHDLVELERLRQQGIQNGVPHLQILPRDKVLEMEPNLNPDVYAALYAPTGGIVDPFQLTIASAEVASLNGVKFEFQTTVTKVVRNDQGFEVMTDKGSFYAKILVNAAGTFSDDVHNFLSAKKLTIRPRKGEYCLFDKQVGQFVHSTIFQLPTSAGKGVLVTPTAEGNLLIGPSSVFIDDKEDKETTIEGIRYVMETAKTSVPNLPMREIITGFAGLRAAEVNGDFILGEAEDVPNLYNAAGIESPGLTAAPAIAQALREEIVDKHQRSKKSTYHWKRNAFPRFEEATLDEKRRLIEENHEYGHIVCRCELVTLAEIKNAIHRPVGATTLDGVKRRTRAGAGRCQGGFCAPKVLEILSEELGKDPRDIAKNSKQSTFLVGLDKEI